MSKRQYIIQKRVLEDKLGAFLAADRIKILQGRGEETEKPLEYWAEQKKEKADVEEKEELIEKFVTMPSPKASKRKAAFKKAKKSEKGGMSRGKLFAVAFLVVAFLVGTSFGIYFMKGPADTSGVAMAINASAFPAYNNTTNVTNTTNTTTTPTTKTNTTTYKTTTTTTPTTNTPSNTQTDTGGSTGGNGSTQT